MWNYVTTAIYWLVRLANKVRKVKPIKKPGGNEMKQIDVLKSLSAMLDYLTSENCTIDPELRSGQGFSLGQQVRVKHKKKQDKYGLVTLYCDYQDGTDNDDIRMRLSGRERFDESNAFDAYIGQAEVVQDQDKSWCQSNNELGEFLDEEGSEPTTIACCAPHGGVIENYTDEQAEWMFNKLKDVHSKDASCWRCAGWQSEIGAFDAWHITSTDISRDSFPKLDSIGDRGFQYAVAFHGFGEDSIMVGGAAPVALKNEVAAAIQAAVGEAYEVVVVSSGSYGGVSPDNFVNWLTSGGSGGVQIEQPYGARRDYGQAIAEAVADVFAPKL
jgi:phage replication-related protein YjqB (UPF0714/DUF867 family)